MEELNESGINPPEISYYNWNDKKIPETLLRHSVSKPSWIKQHLFLQIWEYIRMNTFILVISKVVTGTLYIKVTVHIAGKTLIERWLEVG